MTRTVLLRYVLWILCVSSVVMRSSQLTSWNCQSKHRLDNIAVLIVNCKNYCSPFLFISISPAFLWPMCRHFIWLEHSVIIDCVVVCCCCVCVFFSFHFVCSFSCWSSSTVQRHLNICSSEEAGAKNKNKNHFYLSSCYYCCCCWFFFSCCTIRMQIQNNRSFVYMEQSYVQMFEERFWNFCSKKKSS